MKTYRITLYHAGRLYGLGIWNEMECKSVKVDGAKKTSKKLADDYEKQFGAQPIIDIERKVKGRWTKLNA